MAFLLLFNDLKFCRSSLFCCNGYRHAIFIKKNVSHVDYLRKAFIKNNNLFIVVLLHFYDLNNLNSKKSRLPNKKLGMVPKVIKNGHCHQISSLYL